MRITRAYLGTFIGSKSFYKGALAVMIPVVIQQLINTLFNVVDSVMVSSLGESTMSAILVANKPSMIYNGCFFGLAGAGGLLLSQYYGAGEHDQCQSIFSLQMILGLAFSLLFFFVMRFFPEKVMGAYIQDAQTIAIGSSFLKVLSFSYLPAAVSTICIFSMRALGHNKLPMVVSLAALGMNAVFNYIFIFGKMGFPVMGVEGSAIGTMLARLLEMCIYILVLLRRRIFFSLRFDSLFRIRLGVLKSFFKRAAPLTLNELLWSTGLNIFFGTYAKLDEPSIPAMVIADNAFMVGFVLASGVSSAVSVLVGTELGAGNLLKARQSCKQLFSLVCCVALVSSIVGILCSFIMPYIYPVQEGLRALSTQLTMIYSLFYPINCIYAFCFFCLRAGGDTTNAALLDSGYMWLLPVPVCIAMGIWGVGNIPLMTAIIVVQILMSAKVVLALRIVKRGKWIRNITLEG